LAHFPPDQRVTAQPKRQKIARFGAISGPPATSYRRHRNEVAALSTLLAGSQPPTLQLSSITGAMQLDLTEEETFVLLNLLTETVEVAAIAAALAMAAAFRGRKSGSQLTPRWREQDSNPRSLSGLRIRGTFAAVSWVFAAGLGWRSSIMPSHRVGRAGTRERVRWPRVTHIDDRRRHRRAPDD
jgi:hypothetical protein